MSPSRFMNMTILFLPGYGTHNKIEMEVIIKALCEQSHKVIPHEWSHWNDRTIKWNMGNEIDVILKKLQPYQGKLTIISKSIGTLVTMELIPQLKNDLNKVILMGLPLGGMSHVQKEKYLQVITQVEVPVIVIQNNEDHHASGTEVKKLLGKVHSEIVVVDAKGHTYEYPDLILDVLNG